ncbi:hypothetical protein HDV06_001513 [Boothiomyces sp. JEL0866]|nr:hypothetical protein HDV06_001513 [Boothiomyces sp. JEL0866]
MVPLTEAHIYAKLSKSTNLSEIKSINLWGQSLTDVQFLKNLPQLQVLSLTINKIQSLAPISSLIKLKELYLRSNLVSNPMELQHLIGLPLEIVWFMENPIVNLKQYRQTIIRCLPQLQKLDDIDVSDFEREKAAVLGVPSLKELSCLEWNDTVVEESVFKNTSYDTDSEDYKPRTVSRPGYEIVSPTEIKRRIRSASASNNPSRQNSVSNSPPIPQKTFTKTELKESDKNYNVLYAVLTLIQNLDDIGLAIVRQEIDKLCDK